ncbi:hypothetical protein AGMMS50268_19290 [Spirochaetia bacterium]|nr:hypothetical protein FACS1894110_00840 [Spirochaetia bacterium]GHV56469.1 hypothetical protein AGMMS49579_21070 [Spirochaetia bacterium]GHV91426.1 hypothetical protein AGMMS50268_19290 [Spirochaetia bacterium]
METAVLRKELKSYIDTLPDHSLQALQPLLLELTNSFYSIDTDLTPEEIAEVNARADEYYKDPSSFVALKDL